MANNLVVQLLLKTGTFSNDLKNARGQVQNFQKGCQNAGDAMDAFGRSLGVNIGSLTKFAPAAAAAAAAGKVLKDSFKNNTDAMDAFNREAEVVKSTYRSLTTQLFKNGSMTMDFKGIATQAREYYDAIDQAGVAQVAITNELKLQQVEYDQLYATAMDVSLSEVDRLEALNEASRVMEHQITLKRQMAQFDRQAAKEGLENGLVSSGINKYWLETEGQKMLKELLQFDSANGQYMFDTYFGSVNPNNARTGVFTGHSGAFDRVTKQMSTFEGYKAAEAEALEKGYKNVNEYLDALRKEEENATKVINSTKYQLAQALHNMRGSTQGYEQISKYILLYLNDFGLQQIDAEAKQTRALIERLRKRITGRDGSTPNYPEGTIGYLENELKKYNEDLTSALDQVTRDALLGKIAATENAIAVMKGKKPLKEGSQPWIEEQIKRLTEEISNLDNLGVPETNPILQKMNDWEGSWEEFVNSLTEEERTLFNKFAEDMEKRWTLMNAKLGFETTQSILQGNKTPKTTTPATKEEKTYLQGSYGYKKADLNKRIDEIRTSLTEGVNLSAEDIKKKIAELKALEKEVSDLEEKFGFKTAIKQGTNAWDEFNSAMADTSTIVNALTNTFKENSEVTAASILQMVSTTLPAIGSLISSISALTAAEAVEAGVAATGKAVSTSKHWIEAISAVAALGAVVAAAISAASKPNIQRFANGGIVGGSSFTGDRVSAQVNSGEMILNKTQQANLFRMANGGGTGKEVTFHISGTDLVGVMNNINRKNKVIR